MIPITSFDLETTGVDVETDRIVSAAVVSIDDTGTVTRSDVWLLDPGIDIPEGATAVHGITTEHARASGAPAPSGVAHITATLRELLTGPAPLVVYNAPFDLTLLDRECRRHGVPPLGDVRPVVDPLVLDKHFDTYRPGKRTLEALAAHIAGIEFEGQAHGAEADATTAGRIAQHMLANRGIRLDQLDSLHDAQVGWAHTAAVSLADYFHRIGAHDKALTVRTDWPSIPAPA